ncbi:MAG: hypothetical protein K0S88_4268 [Actinomycetia bacterium]|jgi:hypothetical protein|nr:hypothetical protein [Actinomycetes bacterium]
MGGNDDADLGQDQEWLRESDLINGGLIIIGVYMVQPFLTAASLDLPARVCVVAVSVAIPLLAALVLVNRRELSRHRATRSRLVIWTRVVAQNLAFVAVVAGFWHISWIAGVGMLAGGLMAVAVHAAGYLDLRRDQTPTTRRPEQPATSTPDRPAARPRRGSCSRQCRRAARCGRGPSRPDRGHPQQAEKVKDALALPLTPR